MSRNDPIPDVILANLERLESFHRDYFTRTGRTFERRGTLVTQEDAIAAISALEASRLVISYSTHELYRDAAYRERVVARLARWYEFASK